MRKLLISAWVLTLPLCFVPAAFAQTSVVRNIDRDFNAFASGSLVGGGSISISVEKDLPPGAALDTVSLNVFTFSPPLNVFSFTTTELSRAEFEFNTGTLESARLNTTLPAFGTQPSIAVDITWTAITDIARVQQSQQTVTDNNVFHFSQNAASRFATISGTADSLICCTFSSGSLSRSARQSIQVIHP